MKKTYTFTANLWLYPGKAAWNFISVPEDITAEIDFYFAHSKRGWGSHPVVVIVGKTTWKTSIFPDKKNKIFLLPVKKPVRKAESLSVGSQVSLTIELND
jgi:hypothetical protein